MLCKSLFCLLATLLGAAVVATGTGSQNGRHVTDLTRDEAVRFINRKRDCPFFLYLPFHAPHTPLDERGGFVETPTQPDPVNPERWLHEDGIEWFHDPAGKIQAEPSRDKRLLLATIHHLDGKGALPERDLYWIWSPEINRWALRYRWWKIVKYGRGEPKKGDWQLFNLEEDPHEKENRAKDHPEVVEELHRRFLKHRSRDRRT